MSIINQSIPTGADTNYPVLDPTLRPFHVDKVITFTGNTANTWGDHDGTLDGSSIFEVTGLVRASVIAVVETTLVGAATIELGIAGSTASVLAQVADASGMAAGEIWHDATVDAKLEATTVLNDNLLTQDIILTSGAANVTAGKIRFTCLWYPVSENGLVEASTN